MATTVASRKAKGRNLQNFVVETLLNKYATLTERDVVSVPGGVDAEDVRLSEEAFRHFPFAVECKNQEKLSIWAALKQAQKENRKGIPLLIFKRNRSDVFCCLKLNDFLDQLKENNT